MTTIASKSHRTKVPVTTEKAIKLFSRFYRKSLNIPQDKVDNMIKAILTGQFPYKDQTIKVALQPGVIVKISVILNLDFYYWLRKNKYNSANSSHLLKIFKSKLKETEGQQ